MALVSDKPKPQRGRPRKTAPTPKPTQPPAGEVEQSVRELVAAMKAQGALPMAGAVTAAQSIAAARALDTAISEGNHYGARQAHLSVTDCLAELRKLNDAAAPDSFTEMLAQLSAPQG